MHGHGAHLERDHRMKWYRNRLWSCSLGCAVHRKGPILCIEREGEGGGGGRERGREEERERQRERIKLMLYYNIHTILLILQLCT